MVKTLGPEPLKHRTGLVSTTAAQFINQSPTSCAYRTAPASATRWHGLGVTSKRPPPMPHADFVHLRVHSAYSLSEGAIKADKIAALARDAGMPAVAITDTGNLFGALEFSQACAAQGRAADHRLPDRARPRRQPAPAARPAGAAGAGRDRLRQSAAPVLARLPGNRARPEAATSARRASPRTPTA